MAFVWFYMVFPPHDFLWNLNLLWQIKFDTDQLTPWESSLLLRMFWWVVPLAPVHWSKVLWVKWLTLTANVQGQTFSYMKEFWWPRNLKQFVLKRCCRYVCKQEWHAVVPCSYPHIDGGHDHCVASKVVINSQPSIKIDFWGVCGHNG